jgi:hypothetical protein
MSNFSDYAEQLVATWVFTGNAVTRPTSWWMGLGTGHTDAGLTGEPSGGGYARQQVAFTVTNGVASLVDAETFGPSTASWGTIASAGLFDASTGGNCLVTGALAASRLVESGDSLTVAPGAVTFTVS